MISINELHKSYGKNKVLKGISLDFEKPGITAILGPNGSGKTTLIKSILGMVIPESGTIEVEGKKIKNQWAYRNQIDYLPQIARFPENLRVKELLAMIKDIRGAGAESTKFIEMFRLEPFLNKKMGTLSGGTLQKVNITLALMYDSPIIILDEPTTGLDPLALIHLKKIIKEEKAKGKTILITTHIMSFVDEMADDIAFLLEGKIYFHGNKEAMIMAQNTSNVEEAIAKILERKTASFSSNGISIKVAVEKH